MQITRIVIKKQNKLYDLLHALRDECDFHEMKSKVSVQILVENNDNEVKGQGQSDLKKYKMRMNRHTSKLLIFFIL